MPIGELARKRVLIADDDPIVRLGVRRVIEGQPSLQVCGETDCSAGAVHVAERSNADLAIVDLSLQRRTSVDLIRSLRDAVPSLVVLVLTTRDERLFAEHALRAGAKGYVMKSEDLPLLIDAIHSVIGGGIHVSEPLSQSMLERLCRDEASLSGPFGNLTDRELEVLDLIGRGGSTSSAARELGVSGKTIETYRANIKEKLHLRDAGDLVRFAAAWSAACHRPRGEADRETPAPLGIFPDRDLSISDLNHAIDS